MILFTLAIRRHSLAERSLQIASRSSRFQPFNSHLVPAKYLVLYDFGEATKPRDSEI